MRLSSEERNTGMFYCVRTLYNLVSYSADPDLRSLVASCITDLSPLLNLQSYFLACYAYSFLKNLISFVL